MDTTSNGRHTLIGKRRELDVGRFVLALLEVAGDQAAAEQQQGDATEATDGSGPTEDAA